MRGNLELAPDALDTTGLRDEAPAPPCGGAIAERPGSPRRSRHLAILQVALRIALVAAGIGSVLEIVRG